MGKLRKLKCTIIYDYLNTYYNVIALNDANHWSSTSVVNKVDQSDYSKISIHSRKSVVKLITGTTKWNKQHGSKSTNYNLETWPFEPAEESMCFLRGLSQYMWMEAKNINDSCIFDLQWRVIAVCGSSSEEIVGRWQITAFVKEICLLGVVCKVLNRKTLSGETFCYQN